MVVEHLFCHGKGVVLLVLGRDSHLPLQLPEGAMQLHGGKGRVAQVLQLPHTQVDTFVFMLRFARQVDVPIARITEGRVLRLDGIDQSALLTQAEVEARGQAAATKDVVEQVHRQLPGVSYRVRARANHNVRLVGVTAVSDGGWLGVLSVFSR